MLSYVYLIWIHWLEGRQHEALEASNQAVDLARKLKHPLSLAFALTFAGWHCIFTRDDTGALEFSEELIDFCTQQNILIFLAHGHLMKSWLACLQGDVTPGLQGMQAALAMFRMTGAQHFLPYWDAHYAAVRVAAGDTEGAEDVLTECIDRVDRTGERWCEAELHRYRASVLEQIGQPAAEVEACFHRAIDVARSQGALAWEVRARLDLARYLLTHARSVEASDQLIDLRSTVPMELDAELPGQSDALLALCPPGTVRERPSSTLTP